MHTAFPPVTIVRSPQKDAMTSAQPDPETTGPIRVVVRSERSWRRVLLGAGLVVLLLAAVGAGGVWVGWRWAVDRDTTADGGGAVHEASLPRAVRAPDVRGLAMADAKQAFADAGMDAAKITVVEVPAALRPGTVVAQDPVGGEELTGTLELRVAKEAVVPVALGRPERDVIDELTAFGARVRVQSRYVPDAKADTVLETQPAAGQPVPADVVVVVASAPASVYAEEVRLLTGSCGQGRLKINGRPFEHGQRCSVGRDTTIEILLDRGVQRLTGTLGVPDEGDAKSAVRVVVTGDGKELYRHDFAYGDGQRIEWPTTDVLRLTIAVTALSGSDVSTSLAMGDLTLFGAPDTIAGLSR